MKALSSALVVMLILCVTIHGAPVSGYIEPLIQGNFEAAGLSEAQVRSFLEALQAAVRRGDAAAVSALVSFPLSVTRKSGQGWVRTKAQFVKKFSSIFDSALRKEILSLRSEELFGSSHGVETGSGSLVFSRVCDPDEIPRCTRMRVMVVAIHLQDG
jgi:hypothetical protein